MCPQKRIVSEFADAAASVQAQHEASMAQGGAVGDLAKQRRKAFRDVIKVARGVQAVQQVAPPGGQGPFNGCVFVSVSTICSTRGNYPTSGRV